MHRNSSLQEPLVFSLSSTNECRLCDALVVLHAYNAASFRCLSISGSEGKRSAEWDRFHRGGRGRGPTVDVSVTRPVTHLCVDLLFHKVSAGRGSEIKDAEVSDKLP